MTAKILFIVPCRILILLLFSSSLNAFDHSYAEYEKVLKTYVKSGRVDYASLKKDRSGIDAFIKDIRSVNETEYISWSRDQQLAFWINTYNGWFLQIVIDRYPIRGLLYGLAYPENSVQRIVGLWDDMKIKTAGMEVSLNDIENKRLRPIFRDPRIHFAIVCASLGCPALHPEPFRAESIDRQLESAAGDFITDPTKVFWDPTQNTLKISRIFDWFQDDFASAADDSWRKLYSKKHAGAVAFISRYLPPASTAALQNNKVKVTYLEYDWSLNDVAEVARTSRLLDAGPGLPATLSGQFL